MPIKNVRKQMFGIFIICTFIYGLSLENSTARAESTIFFSGTTSQELQAAITGASSGDTIEIKDDLVFTSTVTIPEGKRITIQSSAERQCTLIKSSNGRHFLVRGNPTDAGTLTLNSIIIDGSGTTGGISVGTSSISGGVLYLNEGATIQNCANTVAQEGGGITVYNGGITIVNGGIIKNNKKNMTNGGGGVYVNGGTFTMNDGKINNNKALGSSTSVYPGGGISSYNSTININGGEICDNEATQNGGGISAGSGSLNITGGDISGNRVTVATSCRGGGVYVSNAIFTMIGGTIRNNTAKSFGGGIYSVNAFTISNSEISGNIATSYGGGIYSTNALTMDECTVSGNITSSNGGGIYIDNNGKAEVSNSKISGNAAVTSGGGVYSGTGSTVAVSNSEIVNNGNKITVQDTSYGPVSNGGGIYLNSSNVAVSSLTIDGKSNISNNNAKSNGGGIYGYIGSVVNANGGIISGNIAGSNGGGIFMYDVKNLKTANATFLDNKASIGYNWILDEVSENSMAKMYSNMHITNIIDTAYTLPYTNAYSNYDVNFSYIQGVTISSHVVTFDYNYEKSVPDIKAFEKGGYITEQPSKERTGYTMEGWYKDKECTVRWDFATETVASDITLYAKWEEKGDPFIYVTTYAYEEFPAGSGIWREIDRSIYNPNESITGVLPESSYTREAPQIGGYALIVPKRPEEVNYIKSVNESDKILRFYYQHEEPTPEPKPNIPTKAPQEISKEVPPEVPPGYENIPKDDGSYEVADKDGTSIGNWKKNKDDDWEYNDYHTVESPNHKIIPQKDGSYNVTDENDTTIGSWNKGEDGNWAYDEHNKRNWTIPFLISFLAGFFVWFIIFAMNRRKITRKELVQMTVQAMKLEVNSVKEVEVYADVPEQSKYYNDIMTAKSVGILTRFQDSEFRPDDAITREEIAGILAEAIRYSGAPITTERVNLSAMFTDDVEMNEMFLDDIRIVIQLEVLYGKSNDRFAPKGHCAKGEAKKIIKKLMIVVSPYLK